MPLLAIIDTTEELDILCYSCKFGNVCPWSETDLEDNEIPSDTCSLFQNKEVDSDE
jgi:hypothetical protein